VGLFYIIERKIKTKFESQSLESRIGSKYNMLKVCINMLVTEFGFTSIFYDKSFVGALKPPGDGKEQEKFSDIIRKREKISLEKLAKIVYTKTTFLNVPI
jgi:hypothetical protein